MNQERKVSILRNLLERVQRRAAAPRVAPAPADGGATAVSAPSFSPVASSVQPAAAPVATAPSIAISTPPAQPTTSARPGSSTLPFDFGSRGESAGVRGGADAFSGRSPVDRPGATGIAPSSHGGSAAGDHLSDRRPTSAPDNEVEEGPPSAPRLREVSDEELPAEERDIDEEEPQLKTPPPESGRQHVTPGPAPAISESDDDVSITVTMEDSEVPPSVSDEEAEGAPIPMSAGSRQEIPDLSGPQPRLALVSEPEIELHGMTPLTSVIEPATPMKPIPVVEPSARPAASSPFRAQDVELAVPVPSHAPAIPSAAPSGVRPTAQPPAAQPPPAPPAFALSRTAPSAGDTKPSGGAPAMVAPAAPSPSVRLMAQPLGETSDKPPPPVEVWASTFTPAVLRGQVASFVGQNANFEPKTFAELLRASIALGDDES